MKHTALQKLLYFITAVLLFALLVPLGVYADEKGTDTTEYMDFFDKKLSYTGVLYNQDNGFITSEAQSVTETPDGLIWIGCYSGLIRYDGTSFFKYGGTDGIPSAVSLYVDTKERLWVGTNDSGVVMIDKETLTTFNKSNGLSMLSVRAICEDKDGNIYIATTAGISVIDSTMHITALDDPDINGAYIYEMTRGGDTIYGVTKNGDVFTIKNKKIDKFIQSDKFDSEKVRCICPDPDNEGNVYLGTNNSVLLYGKLGDKLDRITVSDISDISRLYCEGGYVWICAENGFGVLNSERRYTTVKNLRIDTALTDMHIDYQKNIWLASNRQGLVKIVRNKFTDINEISGLKGMIANTTCISGDRLYIGADNGLTIVNSENTRITNKLTDMLKGTRVRAIKNDSKGNIWLATYRGLIKYSQDGAIKSFTSETGMLTNEIRTMYETSDGTVVVATPKGINLIRDDRVTAAYDTKNGLPDTKILCITQAKDGKLYIGTDGEGIYILDNGKITPYAAADSLHSGVIMQLKNDNKRGYIWAVTGNSIACLKSETEAATITNFPSSNVFDIEFNDSDEAWITANDGLYRVSAEALLADKQNMDYILYDRNIGLPYAPTSNCRNAVKDGIMYVACTSGVASIDINGTYTSDTHIKLAVPYVDCDGKQYFFKDKSVTIPYNVKRLTIYGFVPSYSFDNPRISYQLKGFDNEPVYTAQHDLKAVTYTNLLGGTYTFTLSIVDPLTKDVLDSYEVKIIKQKSFYEHALFPLFVILPILLLIFAIVAFVFQHRANTALKQRAAIQKVLDQMILALSKIIDKKDEYTRGHSFRVAKYSKKLALKLGYTPKEAQKVYNIALLHDVGKILIPIEILNKPGKLTDDEFNIIKSHSAIGEEVLKEINTFPELSIGAGYHHEKYNGKGYPHGATGSEIPEIAQIISLADSFDAMYSTRPYRKQMAIGDVIAEIERCAGTQFNPDFAKAFVEIIKDGSFEKDDPDENIQWW